MAISLNEGNQIDSVLLDFSKAFDKVDHHKLCLKLDHYGIRGKTLNWIKHYLNNRTQTVVVNGEFSDKAPVLSGVPQGTVLGPLLFLVYINDLPLVVNSRIRLFADDALIYRKVENVNDVRQLQHDIDNLVNWELHWSMEFNPDKCKVLRVTDKRKTISAN